MYLMLGMENAPFRWSAAAETAQRRGDETALVPVQAEQPHAHGVDLSLIHI